MSGRTQDHARSAVWAVLTTFVLIVRLLASIATVILVIGWVIATVRDSIDNLFLWPAVISGAALLLSTYAYSYLRARYPRRNGWQP
ncbi:MULTISPECIES: hypothetical protein [unclassified Gordonia (in: high G+C Gram-positive bacteria)]